MFAYTEDELQEGGNPLPSYTTATASVTCAAISGGSPESPVPDNGHDDGEVSQSGVHGSTGTLPVIQAPEDSQSSSQISQLPQNQAGIQSP